MVGGNGGGGDAVELSDRRSELYILSSFMRIDCEKRNNMLPTISLQRQQPVFIQNISLRRTESFHSTGENGFDLL